MNKRAAVKKIERLLGVESAWRKADDGWWRDVGEFRAWIFHTVAGYAPHIYRSPKYKVALQSGDTQKTLAKAKAQALRLVKKEQNS